MIGHDEKPLCEPKVGTGDVNASQHSSKKSQKSESDMASIPARAIDAGTPDQAVVNGACSDHGDMQSPRYGLLTSITSRFYPRGIQKQDKSDTDSATKDLSQTRSKSQHAKISNGLDDQQDLIARLQQELREKEKRVQNSALQVKHQKRNAEASFEKALEFKGEVEHLHKEQNALLLQLESAHNSERKAKAVIADQQKQITNLKQIIHSLSTAEREDVPDNRIQQDFGQLFYDVQDFVISHLRSAHMDLSKLPKDTLWHIHQFAPFADESISRLRPQILMGMVSHLFTIYSRPEWAFGITELKASTNAQELAHMLQEKDLHGYHSWVVQTQAMLSSIFPSHTALAHTKLEECVVQRACNLLAQCLSVNWTGDTTKELSRLVQSALNFFNTLRGQRAVYSLEWPQLHSAEGAFCSFRRQEMEDLFGDAAVEGSRRLAVELMVFPRLTKQEKTKDNKVNRVVVISKAKVVLQQS